MTETVENLILDLLECVGRQERTYQETIDARRTSCPRLPVWEDANDRGLVETARMNGRSLVRVTPGGLALLKEKRPRCCEEWRRQSGHESAIPGRTFSSVFVAPFDLPFRKSGWQNVCLAFLF